MKTLIFFFVAFFFLKTKAQNVPITSNPLAATTIVVGNSNYHVLEAIYLDSEVGANNFISNQITKIEFNVLATGTGPTAVAAPEFNIYLKDVPAGTTTFTDGTYSTSGYTLVYSGGYDFSAVGWRGVTLTTPYQRTPGTNLQILIVRTNNVVHTETTFRSSTGNATSPTFTTYSARTYNGLVLPASGSTNLIATSYRPQIQFYAPTPIDAQLNLLSTPDPACFNTPQSYSLEVKNYGTNPIASGTATVTLKVRGANNFTGTLANTTNIPSDGTETIVFTGVNINNPGMNFDTAYVELTGNNNKTNDTLKFRNFTAFNLTSLPLSATAEIGDPITLGTFYKRLVGTRIIWGVMQGNLVTVSPTAPLVPYAGNGFYVADCYSPNTAGFISRIYSHCVTLPTGSCPKELSFYMTHDNSTARTQLDSLYISVSTDRGVTWTRINVDGSAGLQRHDPTLTANVSPIWRNHKADLTPYSGQTIMVGFDAVSKNGNDFGLDNMEIRSLADDNVALNTTNGTVTIFQNCDQNGWTQYINPITNKVQLAIDWGSNTASKASATVSTTLDAVPYTTTSGSGATAQGSFIMRRYANIVVGTQPTTPVNIRFFYDAAEKTATDAAASSFQAANAGSVPRTPTWFKTNSSNFVPGPTTVTPSGIVNAIPLVDANTSGETINGVLYAQFNGITSFSGFGYTAGVGSATLSMNITSIKASSTGATNTLSWTTVTEINSDKFIIERSIDGANFMAIGEVNSKALNGNSNTPIQYKFEDINPAQGKQYYRLKMMDKNGGIKYSAIATVRRGISKIEIVDVRPNPTDGIVYFNVLGDGNSVGIVVRNILGQTVVTKNTVLPNGFSVDMSALRGGIYLIEVIDERTKEKAVYKIIKN